MSRAVVESASPRRHTLQVAVFKPEGFAALRGVGRTRLVNGQAITPGSAKVTSVARVESSGALGRGVHFGDAFFPAHQVETAGDHDGGAQPGV